mmetsp:Transcript_25528/g.64318  ORF Transcript_25528/g.64318 Transcript_25528/m.64318 type:complete len:269 (-) Transcript_25528:522-1328(-)
MELENLLDVFAGKVRSLLEFVLLRRGEFGIHRAGQADATVACDSLVEYHGSQVARSFRLMVGILLLEKPHELVFVPFFYVRVGVAKRCDQGCILDAPTACQTLLPHLSAFADDWHLRIKVVTSTPRLEDDRRAPLATDHRVQFLQSGSRIIELFGSAAAPVRPVDWNPLVLLEDHIFVGARLPLVQVCVFGRPLCKCQLVVVCQILTTGGNHVNSTWGVVVRESDLEIGSGPLLADDHQDGVGVLEAIPNAVVSLSLAPRGNAPPEAL